MYSPPSGPGGPSAGVRLRPMGIGDILDDTFRLYRENFALFAATVAVVEVPLQIIRTIITLGLTGKATTSTGLSSLSNTPTYAPGYATPNTGALGAAIGAVILTAIITFIGTLLLNAAMAVVISRCYLGQTSSVSDGYNAAASRIGSLVLAALWVGIRLIGLGILCVIIIGIPLVIYFAVAWVFVSQTIMLEGMSGGRASQRSRQLTGGYWWKTVGVLLVTSIIIGIVTGIPSLIVSAVGLASGSIAIQTVLNAIIAVVAGVIAQPLQSIATTLLFYDLKIRKEAFDLEAMASSLGSPPTTSPL